MVKGKGSLLPLYELTRNFIVGLVEFNSLQNKYDQILKVGVPGKDHGIWQQLPARMECLRCPGAQTWLRGHRPLINHFSDVSVSRGHEDSKYISAAQVSFYWCRKQFCVWFWARSGVRILLEWEGSTNRERRMEIPLCAGLCLNPSLYGQKRLQKFCCPKPCHSVDGMFLSILGVLNFSATASTFRLGPHGNIRHQFRQKSLDPFRCPSFAEESKLSQFLSNIVLFYSPHNYCCCYTHNRCNEEKTHWPLQRATETRLQNASGLERKASW